MSGEHVDLGGAATGSSVTVRGEAAIRTEPDEAFVWITLAAIDPVPGPALTDVARRSEGLVGLLDELGIVREDRSTTGITVYEEFDHTKEGRRSLGHRAAASVSVRITDTELIGRVIMRASDELDARIAGPTWRVSASNPVWLEAATQAAANARQKAAAYAAGVDLRLGPLLALAEPEHAPGRFQALSTRAGGSPEVPVETSDQEVSATIQATFALV